MLSEGVNRRMNKLRSSVAKRRKKIQADQFKLKEGHMPTFIDFMLMELQLTDVDLRDPVKKQEIMRLMRAGDQQAIQLVQKAERKQRMDTRKAIQQETDPRKSGLRRKRMNLMRQVDKVDQEINADTLQQQQQAGQNQQSKL